MGFCNEEIDNYHVECNGRKAGVWDAWSTPRRKTLSLGHDIHYVTWSRSEVPRPHSGLKSFCCLACDLALEHIFSPLHRNLFATYQFCSCNERFFGPPPTASSVFSTTQVHQILVCW